MKRPLILLVLIVIAVAAASGWFRRARQVPAPPHAPVAIQDRATVDFSSGRPVIKNDAAEQALIDAALKDIDAAAKNIKFAPLVPPKVEIAK